MLDWTGRAGTGTDGLMGWIWAGLECIDSSCFWEGVLNAAAADSEDGEGVL